MKKSPYLPAGNAQKGIWLSNFRIKLTPALATKLGVSTEELVVLTDDTEGYNYCLILTAASKTFEHQCVTFQHSLKNPPDGKIAISIPVMGPIGVAPKPVASGIFTRVSNLVKKIKLSTNCTEDVSRALGIIGAEPESKSALDSVMPILTGKMVAGSAQIKYIKGTNDGVRLECKRGNETEFSFLDKINKPIYADKRPNLITGKPETREYRAWFFVGDEVVGQVSAVISLTVTG